MITTVSGLRKDNKRGIALRKLNLFFKHCFEVAVGISKNGDLILSKGIMDIPGPRDAEGRAPFAEFPVLENLEKSVRIVFVYENDTSSDIERNRKTIINLDFKTPWMRISYRPKEEISDFFRIYKLEKSFVNKLKHMLNIVPGTKLNFNGNSEYLYYLNYPDKENDIIEKIYISNFINRLEEFENLLMIRIDSRDLTVDLKCDKSELYTPDLIEYYNKKIRQILPEITKMKIEKGVK
jgi:hypothetical protein